MGSQVKVMASVMSRQVKPTTPSLLLELEFASMVHLEKVTMFRCRSRTYDSDVQSSQAKPSQVKSSLLLEFVLGLELALRVHLK